MAYAYAVRDDLGFVLRIEDVDTGRSRAEFVEHQLEDLAALGFSWSELLFQSDRYIEYKAILDSLPHYECYCSRKDIQAAASAPHAAPGSYPGTCRDLTEAEREIKRAELGKQGRVPAIRLRSEVSEWTVVDELHGEFTGVVDDFVLKRDDWAYNFAVVVDDEYQKVRQVVRGEDLLSSAPRQAYLGHLLGYAPVDYIHVPLLLDENGERVAKRRYAPRMVDLEDPLGALASSLDLPKAGSLDGLVEEFLERESNGRV